MRLICPNCGAQYEVAADAIPKAGRDVQCSNCAHTWFETPGASERREAGIEEAPQSAPETSEPQAAPEPTPEPEPEPEKTQPEVSEQQADPDTLPQPEEDASEGWSDDTDGQSDVAKPHVSAAETPVPHAVSKQPETNWDAPTEEALPDAAQQGERSTVTPSVAEILRSEAAHEDARRAEDIGANIESQPDLGLDRPMDRDEQLAEEARRRMARLRGEAAPAIGATTAVASGARGEMLPDVEEINSSLRSETERDMAAGTVDETEVKRKSGFRRGFMTVILIALLALLLYILAPRISAMVPALEPILTSYVDTVDKARLWLDLRLQGLLPDGDN